MASHPRLIYLNLRLRRSIEVIVMMSNGRNILVQLEVHKNGKVVATKVPLASQLTLEGTLINQLYPNINLALVKLPTSRLKEHQDVAVRNALVEIRWKDVTYVMFGSGGGLKDGKVIFVDKLYAKQLHARYNNIPENLLAYAGIHTSDCMAVLTTDDCRVAVVPDNQLGTNDCGAWIRKSLFQQLTYNETLRDPATLRPLHNEDGTRKTVKRTFPLNVLSQGRVANIGENQCAGGFGNRHINAKLTFKVAEDDVMDALGVDIILPESAQKPGFRDLAPFNERDLSNRTWRGRISIGIRDFSKPNTFDCSATVSQNFPKSVVLEELIPKAIAKIEDVISDFRRDDVRKLVTLIGRVNGNLSDPEVEQDDFSSSGLPKTTQTQRFVEAVLLADGSTVYRGHPYIREQFDRLLARRVYKWATGSMIDLPAFALAHDGVLFLDSEGSVRCASDWLDSRYAITSLESDRSVEVRYPVRDVYDLLPMIHRKDDQLVLDLMEVMPGITEDEAKWLIQNQLRLHATYTLNSQRAKENGGDFDFDQICVIDGAHYPMAVEHCFALLKNERAAVTKTKAKRAESPLFNIAAVAVNQLGNKVGIITDHMSTCAAHGRQDLVELLKPILQAALDGLKHGTIPDMDRVKEIMGDLAKPAYLSLKRVTHISKMPEQVAPASPHDVVALIYNMLRPKFTELLGSERSLLDFEMIVATSDDTVSEEERKKMAHEVKVLKSWHAHAHQTISERQKPFEERFALAEKARDEAIASGDPALKAEAWENYNACKAELEEAQLRSKEQRSVIASYIAAWGRGKTENRMAWVQMLNKALINSERYRIERMKKAEATSPGSPSAATSSQSSSKGSLLFTAFPQELVDCIAQRTNGIPTLVEPDMKEFIFRIEDTHFYTVYPDRTKVLEYVYDWKERRFSYLRDPNSKQPEIVSKVDTIAA